MWNITYSTINHLCQLSYDTSALALACSFGWTLAGTRAWAHWNSMDVDGCCPSMVCDPEIECFKTDGQHLWMWLCGCVKSSQKKKCKTGELGQDRLEVRWEAVMFLFNVVNLNVWLFLSVNLAKCFVGVVWLMFGLDEGRVCWGCCGFTVWDSVHCH